MRAVICDLADPRQVFLLFCSNGKIIKASKICEDPVFLLFFSSLLPFHLYTLVNPVNSSIHPYNSEHWNANAKWSLNYSSLPSFSIINNSSCTSLLSSVAVGIKTVWTHPLTFVKKKEKKRCCKKLVLVWTSWCNSRSSTVTGQFTLWPHTCDLFCDCPNDPWIF